MVSTRYDRPLLMALLLAALGPASAMAQTKSSTAAQMPEDGGPVPRAPMPTGGVDDGMKRTGKTGGVDHGGMKRVGQVGGAQIGQHCHEHEHEGEAHSHCHDHADGPEHDHVHPGDQEKGDPQVHEEGQQPEQHCHEHVHEGGVKHSHCHQEHGDPKHEHDHVADVPDEEGPFYGVKTDFGLVISWDGYLRVLAEVIENDPQSTFIGRNDGFRLGNARLGTLVQYEDLSAYISLEAAVGEAESFNDPNQEFRVRLRDAFLRYDFSSYAGVQIGRFKTPYDISALTSSSDLIFIDRPVETIGVLPTRGNEVRGMEQGRQLGVMISKDRVGLSEDGFDVGYALALTNGRTFDLALNDNDRPAGFARLMFHWSTWLTLNLAGFTDNRTVGILPNLFDEDVLGGEVSLRLALFGLTIEGQFLIQKTAFETSGRPDVTAYGAHAQWDYQLWDFRFGYRFAWYEPNIDDLDDADQVMEHTVALMYVVPELPLRFALAGTVALEQPGRKVDNNRITLLAQFRF